MDWWQTDLSSAGQHINVHTPQKLDLSKVAVIEWNGDSTIDEIQNKYGEYIRMRMGLQKSNPSLASNAGWTPIQSAFEFIFGIAQGIKKEFDKRDAGGNIGQRELHYSNLEILVNEQKEALKHLETYKELNATRMKKLEEQNNQISELKRNVQVSLLLVRSRLS